MFRLKNLVCPSGFTGLLQYNSKLFHSYYFPVNAVRGAQAQVEQLLKNWKYIVVLHEKLRSLFRQTFVVYFYCRQVLFRQIWEQKVLQQQREQAAAVALQ